MSLKQVRVWDLPTRIFHVCLASLVIFSIVSIKVGGALAVWHERSGYAILALLAFRLVWGFIGSRTARFADFVRSPVLAARYLFGKADSPTLGHSPVGGLAVVAMLVCLILQATTGLFIDDEIATKGPLADKVSGAVVALATKIHRINQYVIYALIAMHIAAVLFYLIIKKDNLIKPMISGLKSVASHVSEPAHVGTGRALVVLAIAAAAVYWLVKIYAK